MNFRNCFFLVKKSAKVWKKPKTWTLNISTVYPYSLTFKKLYYAKNYTSKIDLLGVPLQKATMDFFLVS